MKELEHLGQHHLLGWGWGPLQSCDLSSTARVLLHSSGHSPSAGAAVLRTGNLGVRLCLSPHAQHEERRKMSLQAKALCFGRSGVWDPQHGDSLAPLLLETRDPRCILPMSCLCWVYVRLTDKAVWWLLASESSPAPVWILFLLFLSFISTHERRTWARKWSSRFWVQTLQSLELALRRKWQW